MHALPECSRPKSIKAFEVDPFKPDHFDLDSTDGAKAAALATAALRAATPNPYALAATRKATGHKPPPGLLAAMQKNKAPGQKAPVLAEVPEEAAPVAAEKDDEDAIDDGDVLQAFP